MACLVAHNCFQLRTVQASKQPLCHADNSPALKILERKRIHRRSFNHQRLDLSAAYRDAHFINDIFKYIVVRILRISGNSSYGQRYPADKIIDG
jgi:hypothetical protein